MSGPQKAVAKKVYQNTIVYGDPGCGKTILAASSPDALILDADPGTESAIARGYDFDVWECFDYHDLTEAHDYVRNEKHDYQWVWLDSGTIFQERALHDQIMVDLVAEKPHRDEFVPDMKEYLTNQNRLGKIIRHFVGLPINFGITAYSSDYDIGEDKKVFMPMFQGGQGDYSTKVCGYMNQVFYLGVQKGEKKGEFSNRLLTRRSGRYYAKDRFGVLDPVIDNPDMAEITRLCQESVPAK